MLILAEEIFHKVPFPLNIGICLFGFLMCVLSCKMGVNPRKNFDGTVMALGLIFIAISQNHFNIPSAVGFLLLMWGCGRNPAKTLWCWAGLIMIFIGVSSVEFWQWGL